MHFMLPTCYVLAEERLYMVNRGILKNDNRSNTGTLREHNRMNWQIDYLEDYDIVKANTSGTLNLREKSKLLEQLLVAARQKNMNAFLIDQTDSRMDLSILEIDGLPKMFMETGFKPADKIAILINKDSLAKGVLRFIENVFSLSCLQIQIFNDSEKANQWLKEKP